MRVITKKRNLFPEKPLTGDTVERIKDIFGKINGISEIHKNNNGSLHIKYDLMKVNLLKIESVLKNYDVTLTGSFIKRFKRGWIHFTEENEYSNMTSSAHACCNTDPTEKL